MKQMCMLNLWKASQIHTKTIFCIISIHLSSYQKKSEFLCNYILIILYIIFIYKKLDFLICHILCHLKSINIFI